MINKISFTGIKPPYTNKKGYHITPISKDPTPFEIQRAIHATKTQEAHSGLNGKAYFYGQDLVVKKYLNKDEALNFNPSREIVVLDKMFDKGVTPKNVQQGKFAFTTPQNETYLVSTRIKGEELNPKTNKFNEQNLRTLVATIGTLDMPKLDHETFSKAQRMEERVIFPYEVPLHYDLSTGNFNINKDGAGIFDLEYLTFVNLNALYYGMNCTNNFKDTLCDISDIPGVLNNLRNFEYRSLLDYIGQISPEERRETFETYLKIKSDYHKKRGEFFRNEVWEYAQKDDEQSQTIARTLRDLEVKEYIHADCLKNLTPEIIKAEAIKIQIAKFVYTQSPFSRSLDEKIYPPQIKKYVREANKFFEECLLNAKTTQEKVYFKDCLTLAKGWQNVIGWMDWQAKEHTIEDLLPSNVKFEDLSKWEKEITMTRLKNINAGRELFLSKCADSNIPTLDEHIGLALLD